MYIYLFLELLMTLLNSLNKIAMDNSLGEFWRKFSRLVS